MCINVHLEIFNIAGQQQSTVSQLVTLVFKNL